MAKSIRSKVKKRNRTEMRKKVGDPHQKMLQARCTARILNTVAFSNGESSSKLRSMLVAAQAANPPTKEMSKSKFSFRHPFAPPPTEEDESSVPPPLQLPLSTSSRSRADTDASMADEDSMADDDGSHRKDSGSAPDGDDEGAQEARSELLRARDAAKLRKKFRKARRRGFVEFPPVEN